MRATLEWQGTEGGVMGAPEFVVNSPLELGDIYPASRSAMNDPMPTGLDHKA